MGRQLAGLRHWLGVNAVPLVLCPLAALLVWVAIWEVWLPAPGAGTPSRRSVTLALVLVVLGVSTAIVGLLHDRLGTLKLDRTGFEITLTKDAQAGAQALVSTLGARNAPPTAYVEGLRRYLGAVGAAPALTGTAPGANGAAAEGYAALARRIADDLVPG